MLEGKKVFVSGGAGVIGRELVKKLHKEGATVFVGDIKQKPKDWSNDILYRQGDLNYITKRELEEYSPEYFIHLAATFERSVESYEFWDENDQHNVRLGHHLMTCLKDSKTIKKVIFASSYLIYQPDLYLFEQPQYKLVSLKETDPIYPRNLTGVAKLLHEIELRFLQEFDHTNYDTVSARIFRVYGKDSRDIVSRWIRKLLNGEKIAVYRKEGMFDYIYSEDVAEGLMQLAKSRVQGVINLGSARARRVSEILDILKQHFPNMVMEETDSDIPYEASQANMERFKKETQWMPNCQIEDGISKIIQHEKIKKMDNLKEETIGNVLVTSASKKVPLINSLKEARAKLGQNIKIYAGDIDRNCIAGYFADESWQMPVLDNMNIEELITYCKEHGINLIIPTRDGELIYFAQNRARLEEQGISVLISNARAIQICLDKLKFYYELKKLGYPVIETSESLFEINSKRYVVKDRFGAGAKSMGFDLSRTEAIEQAKKLAKPIFQPFVEGKEVSIDLYIDKQKKVKGVVVRTRDVVIDGESQVTTTIRDQALEELAVKVVKNLDLYGHIVMQVLIDKDGLYRIVEINSRFGGASSLSLKAGLDSFYWFFLESKGETLRDYPFIRSEHDLKLVRSAKDTIL